MQFAENHVLFGADPTPRIVAVELAGDDTVQVYRRPEAGAPTRAETADFQPFLWLSGEQEGIASEALAGGLAFDRLVRCAGWKEFQGLRADLRERDAKHFALTDPVQQYLTATGRTLFKGMDFGELRRLQIDIETFCTAGFEFSHADRAGDHLMSDRGQRLRRVSRNSSSIDTRCRRWKRTNGPRSNG